MSLPAIGERDWAAEAAAAAPPRPGPSRLARGLRSLAGDALPAAIGLGAALAVWEAWIRIENVKPYLVPAPSRVAVRFYERADMFAEEGLKTLEGAMLGFFVGAGIAIILASVMSQSRFLERAIFPLAILVKVTPIVAIAPLLTIWFGFGLMPKVFIAALIVFFPIMVNALIGFRSVNPNALALLRVARRQPRRGRS